MTDQPFQLYEDALQRFDELLRQEPSRAGAGVSVPSLVPTAEESDIEAVTEDVTRPNGEVYVPRIFYSNVTDVAFVRAAYDKRQTLLLYGSPGTGKTALAEAALPGLITLMGTAETEASDFIGSWVQTPGGLYEWVDGPLIVAMESGLPLLIDEIALIDSRSLAVVYSVMDGRKQLPITINPARGTVEAKDGFMVIGSCNPNVPGAIMSDALLSRFNIHIEVVTDWGLAKKLGVPIKIVTVAQNLAKKLQSGHVMAAPQMREMLNFRDLVSAFGEDFALRNFIGQARREDRHAYTETIKSTYGKDLGGLTL